MGYDCKSKNFTLLKLDIILSKIIPVVKLAAYTAAYMQFGVVANFIVTETCGV